ncbi:isoleucine--tRNA ligase [Dolosigranulum pigrum]|uniref:isoleucine--tRNA ligase n=1 Tax=Dolosigranulum pigrum TaxID=29394 RepID=UPI001AD87D4F|nr:isoleucine--tRNA ligase [Dolosigranulum pigrum]QTJ43473.1 isoleucine--tRNA ligase [Dolosigranulum pigrum]QTJ46887.1 isoleucine--tRNA ligase [Dolosigranulum pigrum]QTJ60407.1 isoleucine--tRNA ligase [Dolosigranulum pigrum]
MKIKDTLNLLKTDFSMRANLSEKEPKMQKNWDDKQLYEKMLERNQDNTPFILHDGPPYANGNIHIGHALNKISKDIIVRYKNMAGFYTPYIPGWDTHGLPIETALTKSGVDRKSMSVAEFRKLCEGYAWKQIEQQRKDFKRLGVQGEWDNPYVTLTPDYEAAQIRVFGEMAKKGYIYRGLKPIYWSPSSESALAEAEIEYQDVRGPSIYVAFDVKDGGDVLEDDTQFVIWTTTPWTIPSNVAITVRADGDYSVYEADGQRYVLADRLAEEVAEKIGWQDIKLVKSFKGAELEGLVAHHPYLDRDSHLILGDHVTFDAGTGLVHTAPGHGDDDFVVGQKYNLPVISPIDSQGYFTDEIPEFEGMFYDDANIKSTDLLKEQNKLLHLEFFTHSYPHDWRTKKPVIFRATPQWFASIDKFRDDILKAVEETDWIQPWGQKRIHNMVANRGDWVISRQRAWGVPLPIFYGENDEPILDGEIFDHIEQLFAEHGSNVWFEREAKDLLPDGYTHPSSPNGQFRKETDIMDVWFDSGSSHEAVLKGRDNLSYPSDLYLEGSDQYRGWFNSSITTGVAVNGQSPYKACLSQGFVLDGDGRKMSKSVGNVIDPNDVADDLGADLIRLWAASVDTSADVRVSEEILGQVAEVYRKIRNTIRFLIQNTADFNYSTDAIAYDNLRGFDQYILSQLNTMVKDALAAYDNYNFSEIYKEINQFCTVVMSNFYMNVSKDVLYIDAPNGYERRAMQTVFYEVVLKLAKLLTPILPHTAEEIWSYLDEEEEFAQLSDLPDVEELAGSAELVAKWDKFMTIRDYVLKANEVAREKKVIGKDFEAKTTLYVNAENKELLESLDADLRLILITSELTIKPLADKPTDDDQVIDFDGVSVKVERMSGEVCTRCRITSEDVVTLPNGEDVLCPRCHAICEEHYPEVLS